MVVSLDVLKDRNAGLLFFGQLISQVCDKMMSVGLVWMFAEKFSPSLIALFLGFSALPHLLLAWKAGPWTLKIGQLFTLIATDAFRGIVFIALAGLWLFIKSEQQIYFLFGASFLANIASALFNPTILAIPVALVDRTRFQQLTAMINSCFSISSVVGPLISALLYPKLGLSGLFLINGLSYLAAAGFEAAIRTKKAPAGGQPSHPESEGEQAMGNMDQADPALQVLEKDSVTRWMLGGFLASNLFLAPLMVILPLFAKSVYGGAISTLAELETSVGIGTIVGGLLLALVKLDSRLGRKISIAMVSVALAYLGFSMTRNSVLGDLCLFVLGLFLTVTNVFSVTLFQTRLKASNVPTIMSLVNLISVASLPVSMTVVSLIGDKVPVVHIAPLCAIALLLVTLAVVSRREIREV